MLFFIRYCAIYESHTSNIFCQPQEPYFHHKQKEYFQITIQPHPGIYQSVALVKLGEQKVTVP